MTEIEAFDILGLQPDASAAELKDAYRDLVKVWHPDRFPNDPKLRAKAQEKLKDVNEAYAVLNEHIRAGRGPSSQSSENTQSRPSAGPAPPHAQTASAGPGVAHGSSAKRNRLWVLPVCATVGVATMSFLTSGSRDRPKPPNPSAAVGSVPSHGEPSVADVLKSESLQSLTSGSSSDKSNALGSELSQQILFHKLPDGTVVFEADDKKPARPDAQVNFRVEPDGSIVLTNTDSPGMTPLGRQDTSGGAPSAENRDSANPSLDVRTGAELIKAVRPEASLSGGVVTSGRFTDGGADEVLLSFSDGSFSHAEGWERTWLVSRRRGNWKVMGQVPAGIVETTGDIDGDGVSEVLLRTSFVGQGYGTSHLTLVSLSGFPIVAPVELCSVGTEELLVERLPRLVATFRAHPGQASQTLVVSGIWPDGSSKEITCWPADPSPSVMSHDD